VHNQQNMDYKNMAASTQMQGNSRSAEKLEAAFVMNQKHSNYGLFDGFQPIHPRVTRRHTQVLHIPACFIYL
jgi:hypothetical protein